MKLEFFLWKLSLIGEVIYYAAAQSGPPERRVASLSRPALQGYLTASRAEIGTGSKWGSCLTPCTVALRNRLLVDDDGFALRIMMIREGSRLSVPHWIAERHSLV
jgi:hypothetical protein